MWEWSKTDTHIYWVSLYASAVYCHVYMSCVLNVRFHSQTVVARCVALIERHPPRIANDKTDKWQKQTEPPLWPEESLPTSLVGVVGPRLSWASL